MGVINGGPGVSQQLLEMSLITIQPSEGGGPQGATGGYHMLGGAGGSFFSTQAPKIKLTLGYPFGYIRLSGLH